MTDTHLRSLARQAAVDPSARVALLRERMRAGEIDRSAVELAAYCGDEAAREVLGSCHEWCCEPGGRMVCSSLGLYGHRKADCDECQWIKTEAFHKWLSGLDRWPGALVRAVVAAARVAHEITTPGDYGWCWEDVEAAINAAEAWIECPCEEHLAACEKPGRVLLHVDSPWDAFGAIWWHWRESRFGLNEPLPDEKAAIDALDGFAHLINEAAVRKAICEALIEWTLGDQRIR